MTDIKGCVEATFALLDILVELQMIPWGLSELSWAETSNFVLRTTAP